MHLLSATCFVIGYALVFIDPVKAVMIGWMLAMVLRQTGHFYFEPKTYDVVNNANHEYKGKCKVGYNLKRKIVLMSLMGGSTGATDVESHFFGLLPAGFRCNRFHRFPGHCLVCIGIGAILFRTVPCFSYERPIRSGMGNKDPHRSVS